MSTLDHLPPAERHPHGTRARYVAAKCRCRPCKDSNRRYYHQRKEKEAALIAELVRNQAPADSLLGPSAVQLSPQVWTAPDGTKQVRLYSRACPGVGSPCPSQSHLRKDSKGGICRGCRYLLALNDLVPAEAARAHVLELGRRGVGYKSVAAAASVAISIVARIRAGTKTQLRRETERRILAVDVGAAADNAHVSKSASTVAIAELLRLGLSKAEISRRLGNKAPALQLVGRRITVRNAHAIAKLLRDERAARHGCPRCGQSHRDDKLAAEWCRKNVGAPIDPLELQGAR